MRCIQSMFENTLNMIDQQAHSNTCFTIHVYTYTSIHHMQYKLYLFLCVCSKCVICIFSRNFKHKPCWKSLVMTVLVKRFELNASILCKMLKLCIFQAFQNQDSMYLIILVTFDLKENLQFHIAEELIYSLSHIIVFFLFG